MTLYELLGVDENANQDEIKRAYRKAAMKFHPDVSKEKDAEEMFKQINAAYEILSDQRRRTIYDHSLVVQRCIPRPGESLFWSDSTTGMTFTVNFVRD